MLEEIRQLLAKVAEYEHALTHVAEFHPTGAVCADCQRLAKSALDGENRADFLEQVDDEYAS